MLSAAISAQIAADYGSDDILTPQGSARFIRACNRDERLQNAGHFVGACHRLARRRGIDLPECDPRLLAAGFCRSTPTAWIVEGGLQKFLQFWNRSVPRPKTVGSSYNPPPEMVLRGMTWGYPSRYFLTALWRHFPLKGPLRGRDALRIRRAVRAAGRSSLGPQVDSDYGPVRLWSLRGLEALGRLSPEAQRILLQVSGWGPSVWGRSTWGQEGAALKWGTRRLRWDLAAPLIRELKKPSRRVYWAKGFRRATLAGGEDKIAAAICPAYPRVEVHVAERISEGTAPVEIFKGLLTKKEAHEALTEGISEALTYLDWKLQSRLLARYENPEVLPPGPLRSPALLRWALALEARGGWGQLLRKRTVHGPAGLEVEFCFLEWIDELQDVDLVRGDATRADEAFEACARRIGSDWLTQAERDHRVLCDTPAGDLARYRGVRVLRTPAELVREGREMAHCVGGYAPAVEAGQVWILALRAGPHRSTAEVQRSTGYVFQHRGRLNREPEACLQRLLQKYLAAIRFR